MKQLRTLIMILTVMLLPVFTIYTDSYAGEAEAGLKPREETQPVVDALTPIQKQPQVASAPTAKTTIDFIRPASPLSSTSEALELAESIQEKPLSVSPEKVMGEPLNTLVSEKCSESGAAKEGTNTCMRTYSNGYHAKIVSQHSDEGDEFKRQTLIEEYDPNERLLYKKTIRQRVDFNYFKEKKTKEKELFDIVYQPTGKKATRELIVYQYYLDTEKLRTLSWTQYKQIGNQPKASLNFYTTLRYGEDGSPERGIAEKWEEGHKITSFMNWNRLSSTGFTDLNQDSWEHWEHWIQGMALQANFR